MEMKVMTKYCIMPDDAEQLKRAGKNTRLIWRVKDLTANQWINNFNGPTDATFPFDATINMEQGHEYQVSAGDWNEVSERTGRPISQKRCFYLSPNGNAVIYCNYRELPSQGGNGGAMGSGAPRVAPSPSPSPSSAQYERIDTNCMCAKDNKVREYGYAKDCMDYDGSDDIFAECSTCTFCKPLFIKKE